MKFKWIVRAGCVLFALGALYYFYPEPALSGEVKIDSLVVIKHERVMHAYSRGKKIKTYPIALGRDPVGDKQYEGDKRTPEGEYQINAKNPYSGYHKNLGVSYPDGEDVRDAKARKQNPGGDIKIHGLRNGLEFIGKFHRLTNWTAGCIAVTNPEMDELYRAVDVGAHITILP